MSVTVNICVLILLVVLTAGGASAGDSQGRVLFDQGHDQRFLIEEKGDLQLSGFAEIIRSGGAMVSATADPLTDSALESATSLIISGPFRTVRPEEIEAVLRFVEKGGRLAVMLHIGSPLTALLAGLDLDHSNAVLHERNMIIDSDINFRVTDLGDSPLFSGLTEFSTYGCWALDPGRKGMIAARTSAESWFDLDGNRVLSPGDVQGAFPVVVTGTYGSGSFAVFGDDAIFQNRYLDGNNRKLAANLADWLRGK